MLDLGNGMADKNATALALRALIVEREWGSRGRRPWQGSWHKQKSGGGVERRQHPELSLPALQGWERQGAITGQHRRTPNIKFSSGSLPSKTGTPFVKGQRGSLGCHAMDDRLPAPVTRVPGPGSPSPLPPWQKPSAPRGQDSGRVSGMLVAAFPLGPQVNSCMVFGGISPH